MEAAKSHPARTAVITGGEPMMVSLKRVAFRLVDNFQFFWSTVATYILLNGGFIMLKPLVRGDELGFFALAQRVSLILRMVPVFLTGPLSW